MRLFYIGWRGKVNRQDEVSKEIPKEISNGFPTKYKMWRYEQA